MNESRLQAGVTEETMSAKFFVICIIFIGSLFAINHFLNLETSPLRTAQVTETRSTGEVLIGGPFTLTNHKNETVNESDFRGKLMLVFFGFSHCPDICPTELNTMSNVIETLGKDADKVAPLYITVDPERDTVEQLALYMENFHPSLIALTGSREHIDAVMKTYRIYARKVQMAELSDYMMDHTAYTYLMNKEGRYITHFPAKTKPEKMLEMIKKHL